MSQKLCRDACDREENAGHQVHIISEAFACDLRSRGYATSAIGLYGRIVVHFGRWLAPCVCLKRGLRRRSSPCG